MPNFCIMRMQKIKSTSEASARLKHARREIPCKTVRDPNAKNVRITMGDEMKRTVKMSFAEIFKERTAGQNVRKNAVRAIEVMLTFSPGAVETGQLRDWAGANMSWLEQTFGGRQNIIDAQLHMDETTPHIHAMVIPIDERGKLNARAFLGGNNHRMRDIQTEYAKAMEKFGLKRGISREITRAKHQSHLRWIAENALKEATLQAYEDILNEKLNLDRDLDLRLEIAEKVSQTLQKAPEELETPLKDISLEDLR